MSYSYYTMKRYKNRGQVINMKAYIALIVIVLFSGLYGVNVIELDNPVNTFPERNSGVMAYHNGIDEQHWYGTNRWAVHFVSSDFYSVNDSAMFDAEGVSIYLFNPSGTISFRLYKTIIDDDSLLTSCNHTFQDGDASDWYDFNFDGDVEALPDLWLVIDYETDEDSPYMSANNGDGSRCFYWEALSETEGYFRNNAGSGLSSDFLVGLQGHYTFASSNDIALIDFGITGRVYPDGEVQAYYTIRNNNSYTVNDININYSLTPPPSSGLSSIPLALTDLHLDPYETKSDTASFDDSFLLPSISAQYDILANLTSSHDDILTNNALSTEINVFLTPLDNKVVENFVDSDANYFSSIMTNEEIFTPDFFILNYFPEQSDLRFFRTSSGTRSSFYNNFGLPNIVVQGYNKLTGYSDENEFADTYYAATNSIASDKTFLQSSGYMVGMDASENIYIDTYVQQIEDTYLFSQYYGDCAFHAGIFQTNVPLIASSDDIIPGMILLKSLTPINGMNLQGLADSTEAFFAIDFSRYDLDIIDDHEFDDILTDLHFVYWIQHEETKQIFLIDSATLDYLLEGVSVKDNDVDLSIPDISVYPNPSGINGSQHISFSIKEQCDGAELEIYNIKGQKVKRIVNSEKGKKYNFFWNFKDSRDKSVSSGVYLYRFNVRTGGKTRTFHTKSVLLK